MNGTNIGTFDPTAPADTQSAGLGDDAIRSVKTTFQTAMADEHNFPAAGGSVVGYHLLGSGRAFFGTQSAVSSSGTEGRLMVTSNTSRLFGVGSGGTVFYGGATVLSMGTETDTASGRHHWVDEVGEGFTNPVPGVSGFCPVTIPNSGYSGRPYVYVTGILGGGDVTIFNVESLSATSFTVVLRTTTGAVNTSGMSFFWLSRGTRAL